MGGNKIGPILRGSRALASIDLKLDARADEYVPRNARPRRS
jgi:hypothetical protein